MPNFNFAELISFLRTFIQDREYQLKLRPESGARLHPDTNSIHFSHMLNNSQTQPGRLFIMLYGLFGTVVLLENTRQLIPRNTYSVVFNNDNRLQIRPLLTGNTYLPVSLRVYYRI